MSNDAQHNDDQKNVDRILLTIGALVCVAVFLFVVARFVNNLSLQQMHSSDDAYQAAVNERIKPIGTVVLDGEAVADPGVQAVAEAAEAPAKMTGPQVYNAACLACHGGGIGGAPKTGEAAAWGPRIAQGIDVLKKHAIEGFQGSAGYMPPKGGRVDLSDEEIHAAVEYLVDQAQ